MKLLFQTSNDFRQVFKLNRFLVFVCCAIGMLSLLNGCRDSLSSYGTATTYVATDAKSTPEEHAKIANISDTSINGTDQPRNSLVIGLDADMSSGSAMAGEAIRRGIVLAIDKINAEGGLLGKNLRMEIRDHRGNPDRGVDNLKEFADMPNLLAVVGGIHTPVALEQLPTIHNRRVLYLGPWAAGTPIVSNGYDPNFVFRVSVRDEYAGGFLVEKAIDRGLTNIGLLLERTSWGRSNEKAIVDALTQHGMKASGIEWFNWGEKRMDGQIRNLMNNGTDVILLVSNPLEGVQIIQTMASLEESKRIPIISHWGISAANVYEQTEPALRKVDLTFIQSFSFLQPKLNEKAQTLIKQYIATFPSANSARDIFSPVGTAHAYEIVMMLAQAVETAKSADSMAIKNALENLSNFSGVIRDFQNPFRIDHHDALNRDDFILARFATDGTIVPAGD